jgi:hypothetical protein
MERRPQHEKPRATALLLVEAGLWTRYYVINGELVAASHAAGPIPDDVVAITAEPVLQALLAGRPTLDQITENGLFFLDDAAGSGQSMIVALQRAFRSGSTKGPTK